MPTSLVLTGLDDSSRRTVSLSNAALPAPDDADLLAVEDESDRVVKRYRDPTTRRREKIAAMLDAPPEPPSLEDAPGLDDEAEPSFVQLAWPTAHAETENGDWVGYAMPTVDRDRCTTLQHLLSADDRDAKNLSNSYRLRIGAAYHLAELVEALHAEDHYVVDLIPSRVHLDREAFFVALTGCDDFSVAPRTYGGDRFAGPAPTPGYTVPEVARGEETLPEYGEEQDCFALAVVVFQLLNRGLHPYEGPYREGKEGPSATQERINENLYAYGRDEHPTVQPASESLHPWFDNGTMRLFEQALEGGGIGNRPSASRWRRHLQAYVARKPERLQVCDQNEEHATYPGQECGFCALEEQRSGYGEKLTETQEDKWTEIDEEEDEWTETSEEEDDWTETSTEEEEWIETDHEDEESWTDTEVGGETGGSGSETTGSRDDSADRSGKEDQGEEDDGWVDDLEDDWEQTGPEPPDAPVDTTDATVGESSQEKRSQETSTEDNRTQPEPQPSESVSSQSTKEADDPNETDGIEDVGQEAAFEEAPDNESTTYQLRGRSCAITALVIGLGTLFLLFWTVDALLLDSRSKSSDAKHERTRSAGATDPSSSSSEPESEEASEDPAQASATSGDTTSAASDETTSESSESPDYDTLAVGGDYLQPRLEPRTGTPQIEVTSHPEFDRYYKVIVQRVRDGDTTTVLRNEEAPHTVVLDSFRRGDRIRAVAYSEASYTQYARGNRVLVTDTTYTASIADFARKTRNLHDTDPTVVGTSTTEVPLEDGSPPLQVSFSQTNDVRTLVQTSFPDGEHEVAMAMFYRAREGNIESLGLDKGPSPTVDCFDLKSGDKVALLIYPSGQKDVIRVGLEYRGPDREARLIQQLSGFSPPNRR